MSFVELPGRFINLEHIVEVHNDITSHWRVVLANGTRFDLSEDRADTLLAALRASNASAQPAKRRSTTKKAETN